MLRDGRFWVGVAVGLGVAYFVLPRIARQKAGKQQGA